MSDNLFQGFIYFLAGLLWGSFLGIIADRVPKGESIAHPPSRCSNCQTRLSYRDLIPLWSWLSHRGRCRYCGHPIDPFLLVSELGTGLFFGLLPLVFSGFRQQLVVAVFFSFAFPLSLIDLRYRRLPHALTWSAAVCGIFSSWFGPEKLLWSFWGFLSGFLLLGMIAYFYPKGMGMGDAFWIGAIGTFVGARGVIETLFLSSLLALIATIPFYILARQGEKNLSWHKLSLPFGPFLSVSALLIMSSPVDWVNKLLSETPLNLPFLS